MSDSISPDELSSQLQSLERQTGTALLDREFNIKAVRKNTKFPHQF